MNANRGLILVSVVIPLFNEEENIKEVYYRTEKVLTALNKNYEIIFIDDGSKDKTCDIIKDIRAKNVCVKIIKLAKNHGQHYALLAGFELAKGDIIISMDGDLQNDPYDIPKFLEKIEENFDLVNGWRYERKDPLGRKLISKISNWLIRKKTGIALHDYGCAFIAIKKELINKLKGYGTNARFIKPLLVRLADSPVEIKINHNQRKFGISKYSLFKVIRVGLDFIFNFKV